MVTVRRSHAAPHRTDWLRRGPRGRPPCGGRERQGGPSPSNQGTGAPSEAEINKYFSFVCSGVCCFAAPRGSSVGRSERSSCRIRPRRGDKLASPPSFPRLSLTTATATSGPTWPAFVITVQQSESGRPDRLRAVLRPIRASRERGTNKQVQVQLECPRGRAAPHAYKCGASAGIGNTASITSRSFRALCTVCLSVRLAIG